MATNYSNMNSTNLLAKARMNFRLGRWTNVTKALANLNSRNLTSAQRNQLNNLSRRVNAWATAH